MANYSLVVNSKFRPYSFDELVKPYAIYGQAYDEQQNQLSDLAVKSNVWKGLANEQTDPTAYKMYKTYADDLETRVGMLAKEGLTPASRKSMLDMKTRYSSEITPLENAWKARDEQRKMQEQLQTQDPTLLLSRRASTTSLDDYIKNPELSYNSYSGKLVTAQVAQAAGALAKELKNYGTGKPIDAFTNTFMKKYGFSSSEVLNAINNPKDPKSSKVLGAIVDQAVGSSGVANWNNPQELARVQDYAKQGLWSAVGTTEVAPMENFGARATLQANLADRNAKRAEDRAAARAQQQQVNSIAINPLNLYSSRDQDAAAKNMKDYAQYFHRDSQGRLKMTWKGWQEYNRNAAPVAAGPTSDWAQPSRRYPSAFRKFMDSLGARKVTGGKWQPGNLGNIWGRYQTVHDSSRYDTNKVTEFDYTISGAQQGDMKDAILTANRGLPLSEVDYDSKTKTFKSTGNSLELSDLKSDKYKVTATRFSPYGSTVMIQDKDGNVHRYKMPTGINTTNENNRDRILKRAAVYQDMMITGKYKTNDGKEHLASPSELQYAQQAYNQALQEAYFYHSQLGVQNKTEEQKFNPVGY